LNLFLTNFYFWQFTIQILEKRTELENSQEAESDNEDSPQKENEDSDEEVAIMQNIAQSGVWDPQKISLEINNGAEIMNRRTQNTPKFKSFTEESQVYMERRMSHLFGDSAEIKSQIQNYILK